MGTSHRQLVPLLDVTNMMWARSKSYNVCSTQMEMTSVGTMVYLTVSGKPLYTHRVCIQISTKRASHSNKFICTIVRCLTSRKNTRGQIAGPFPRVPPVFFGRF